MILHNSKVPTTTLMLCAYPDQCALSLVTTPSCRAPKNLFHNHD